jgi:tripartite-type tricarboxylate transporter receptor subunit TctC
LAQRRVPRARHRGRGARPGHAGRADHAVAGLRRRQRVDRHALAPAGTPREIVDTLAQAARRVVADPDHAAKLTDFGAVLHFHGPDETAAIWQATEQRLTPLLEQLER